MLHMAPENVSQNALGQWENIEPLSLQKFKDYSPEYAPLDFKDTEFKQWVYCDAQFFWTVHRESQQPHGIVRKVALGGFKESQYFNGMEHGYVRGIAADGSFYQGTNRAGDKFGKWTVYKPDGRVREIYTVSSKGEKVRMQWVIE